LDRHIQVRHQRNLGQLTTAASRPREFFLLESDAENDVPLEENAHPPTPPPEDAPPLLQAQDENGVEVVRRTTANFEASQALKDDLMEMRRAELNPQHAFGRYVMSKIIECPGWLYPEMEAGIYELCRHFSQRASRGIKSVRNR
jgi:hypothetical protein